MHLHIVLNLILFIAQVPQFSIFITIMVNTWFSWFFLYADDTEVLADGVIKDIMGDAK